MKKSVNLMQKLCPASVTYQIRYAEPVLKLEGAMTTAKNLPDKLTLIYPSANGHALSTNDCALPQDTQECIIPLHPFLRLSASRKSGSQY